MKMTALIAFVLSTQTALANPFFSRIDHYIDNNTGKVFELSKFDINEENKTATYYDYAERKKTTVDLNDITISTNKEIAGVKAGEHLLIERDSGTQLCAVWYLFENGKARVGCQTGKLMSQIGPARHAVAAYNVSSVEHSAIIEEVAALDGVSKKNSAILLVDTKAIDAGSKVTIEAIFANGEVLVQKKGFSFLDTSSLILKTNVEKVNLNQLSVKHE